MKYDCKNTPILDTDNDAGTIGRFTGRIELLRDLGEVTLIEGVFDFFKKGDKTRVMKHVTRLKVDLTSEGDRVWCLCHTDKHGPAVYAVAEKIPPHARSYMTAGKEYKIEEGVEGISFNIVGDNGEVQLCLWHGCAHLNGICKWRKVVK